MKRTAAFAKKSLHNPTSHFFLLYSRRTFFPQQTKSKGNGDNPYKMGPKWEAVGPKFPLEVNSISQ